MTTSAFVQRKVSWLQDMPPAQLLSTEHPESSGMPAAGAAAHTSDWHELEKHCALPYHLQLAPVPPQTPSLHSNQAARQQDSQYVGCVNEKSAYRTHAIQLCRTGSAHETATLAVVAFTCEAGRQLSRVDGRARLTVITIEVTGTRSADIAAVAVLRIQRVWKIDHQKPSDRNPPHTHLLRKSSCTICGLLLHTVSKRQC